MIKDGTLKMINVMKSTPQLHESTLTSTCGGTQAINNRQSHEG